MRVVQTAVVSVLVGSLVCLGVELRAGAQGDTAKGPAHAVAMAGDGQHDFDFEFGSWHAHLRRLLHPLTGSHTWVEYDGTSIVHKLWDGRGNIGELEVGSASSHIEGLTLRLYNPQSRQWSIYWSNSQDGALGTPMIGQFDKNRGTFFGQDSFQGRAVYVRFIFSDLTPSSFQLEQAFSADGGETWEPNWIATFARVAS